MQKEECLKFYNASLGYKQNSEQLSIVKNVNLSFFSGELVGMVGLNGVGKSTFLKSMCGLLPLLSGDILIQEQPISKCSITELAKKIAVVLTEKIAGFNLTAYDVVAAGQMPYTNAFNRLESSHHEIIDVAIKTCGISDHQHKLLNELSDGLFQKTIIAKALAQQTPIILLDEPSAFLDYASKHELFLLLQKLANQQNKCVLVSSHDLDLLLKYCTKLVIISNHKAELISTINAKTNLAFLEIAGGFL